MKVELRKNMVYLYNLGASSPIDFFKKGDLARTIKIEGHDVSECIYLLSKKTWIEIYDLYNLAVIIQNEFPDNEIDWEKTFYSVEKDKMVTNFIEEYERCQRSEGMEPSSLFDSILMRIQFGIGLESLEKNIILENLNKNLKFYGLN